MTPAQTGLALGGEITDSAWGAMAVIGFATRFVSLRGSGFIGIGRRLCGLHSHFGTAQI
jgi:hypothetical protein